MIVSFGEDKGGFSRIMMAIIDAPISGFFCGSHVLSNCKYLNTFVTWRDLRFLLGWGKGRVHFATKERFGSSCSFVCYQNKIMLSMSEVVGVYEKVPGILIF